MPSKIAAAVGTEMVVSQVPTGIDEFGSKKAVMTAIIEVTTPTEYTSHAAGVLNGRSTFFHLLPYLILRAAEEEEDVGSNPEYRN